jgi:hypothetical protein
VHLKHGKVSEVFEHFSSSFETPTAANKPLGLRTTLQLEGMSTLCRPNIKSRALLGRARPTINGNKRRKTRKNRPDQFSSVYCCARHVQQPVGAGECPGVGCA